MLSLDRDLIFFGDMLSHLLLWSFLTNVICYGVGGVVAVVNCKRRTGGLAYCLGLVVCGILKTFILDLVSDVFLVSIYVTSGWSMHPGYAFGWGFGISLGTIIFNCAISFIPCYPIL